MNKFVLAGVSALSAFVLTACGGGGGGGGDGSDRGGFGNNSSASVNGIPSNFVGVWDATTDEGADGIDQFFVVIDANGKISLYDFAGDSFDDWGNCYWIEKDAFLLTPLGGSKYRSTVTISGSEVELEDIEITVSGNVMTTKSKDVDDIDDDGNTTETNTDTMKKSSRSVESFTPECTDNFNTARSLIPAKQAKSLNLLP